MDGADCTDGVRNVFRNAIFDILLILEGFLQGIRRLIYTVNMTYILI